MWFCLPTSRGSATCKLPHIDWFLPNDAEAAVLTGQTDPLEAIAVFRSWGAHGLVVTLGDRGAVGVFGDEAWRCQAHPWQTVDPSGLAMPLPAV